MEDGDNRGSALCEGIALGFAEQMAHTHGDFALRDLATHALSSSMRRARASPLSECRGPLDTLQSRDPDKSRNGPLSLASRKTIRCTRQRG